MKKPKQKLHKFKVELINTTTLNIFSIDIFATSEKNLRAFIRENYFATEIKTAVINN